MEENNNNNQKKKSIILLNQKRGILYIWGKGLDQQLGLKSGTTEKAFPCLLSSLEKENIRTLACGRLHTIAISTNGDIYSWGSSSLGQCGHNSTLNVQVPTQIEAMKGINCREVACGDSHTIVLTDTGKLFGFGNGSLGQLGTKKNKNSLTPKRIVSLDKQVIIFVACGSQHTGKENKCLT